jgi:hypothetical protein
LTKSSVYAHRVRRATCEDSHPTFECHHHECVCMSTGTTRHPPHCPHNGYGVADDADRFRCKCTAYPYNPFSGEPVTGDLMRTTLSAKATDGNNTLYPISFPAVTTCVPDSMLEELPAGAVGVAGLARSRLALPAQVAHMQKIAKKFMLCLSSAGASIADGAVVFGENPLLNVPAGTLNVTAELSYTSLHNKVSSSGYYVSAKAIAIGKAQVQLPWHALANGGVVFRQFSTRVWYMMLRPDVYRALVDAFHKASGWEASAMVASIVDAFHFDICWTGPWWTCSTLTFGLPQC